MRRLWIAAVILCGVAILCVTSSLYRHHRVGAMLDTLDQLEQAYTQGNTAHARQLADALARDYRQSSRVLFCYTAHSNMTESLETVALLPLLLQQDDGDELQREIARLRSEWTYLKHIDDPLLRNIL